MLLVPLLVMAGIGVAQATAGGTADGHGEFRPADTSGSPVSGLITAEGAELRAGDEAWSPIGFNDYRLTAAPGGYVCDSDYGAISDAELAVRLDRIRAAGGTAVRTWFFQSSWDPDGDGDGEWGAFDRVIEAAADRGLRVIPVLGNHWSDCENGEPEKDLDFYAGGFEHPRGSYALSFRDYAVEVAGRYEGEPAVAWWQLINEPEAPASGGCDEPAAAAALRGFADRMSAALRAADPHHMVGLGTIGGGQCGTAGPNYASVNAALDVCEIHVYDDEHTGSSPLEPMPGDAANGAAARIAGCESAGKPIVLGEVGYEPDLGADGMPTGAVGEATLANRAGFLAERVGAMQQAGLDGYLVWQLDSDTPNPNASGDRFGVGPCDPIEDVIRADGEPVELAAGGTGCAEGAETVAAGFGG